MNKYLSVLFIIVFVCSCQTDEAKLADWNNEVVFNRLDSILADYASLNEEQRVTVVDSLRYVIDAWFNIQGKREINDNALMEYSNSDAVKVFYKDVCAKISNISELSNIVLKLEDNIYKQFRDSCFFKIYSVVSPYNQSIFIVDSIMFIGLNHYLGSDYPGYGYFEPYQRIVKTPQHMPYDIAEAYLIDRYPYIKRADASVLNTLLYNGAIVYTLMQIVPNADLAEALGYSEEQLLWADGNENDAWNALILRNLLYSTSQYDANRLVVPSPATSILHKDSPGRLGRYIGYKIVKSYVENHSNKNLEWLLSPDFYNSIQSLIDSKYGL